MTFSGSVSVTAREGDVNLRGRPRRGTRTEGLMSVRGFLRFIHKGRLFSSKKSAALLFRYREADAAFEHAGQCSIPGGRQMDAVVPEVPMKRIRELFEA